MDLSSLIPGFYVWIFIVTFVVASILKAALSAWHHKTAFSFDAAFANGGMPSVHSAIVTALTLGVLFKTGFSDIFYVSLIFSLIVITDAIRVRGNVGIQGESLNVVLKKLHKKPIHVVYGHTPTQVCAGILLGAIVSVGMYMILLL